MPITLFIISVLLYLSLKRVPDVLMVLLTMPFALVGGIGLVYLLGFQLSVAVAVGFIALAGVAIEIGILMMLYLNQAWDTVASKSTVTLAQLTHAVQQGASARLRPILMTSLSSVVGLLPIMFSDGTGSQVMQRIAAPMIGGMISTILLSLFILPSLFFWIKSRQISRH